MTWMTDHVYLHQQVACFMQVVEISETQECHDVHALSKCMSTFDIGLYRHPANFPKLILWWHSLN